MLLLFSVLVSRAPCTLWKLRRKIEGHKEHGKRKLNNCNRENTEKRNGTGGLPILLVLSFRCVYVVE